MAGTAWLSLLMLYRDRSALPPKRRRLRRGDRKCVLNQPARLDAMK
jgi:hypothetical protein